MAYGGGGVMVWPRVCFGRRTQMHFCVYGKCFRSLSSSHNKRKQKENFCVFNLCSFVSVSFSDHLQFTLPNWEISGMVIF